MADDVTLTKLNQIVDLLMSGGLRNILRNPLDVVAAGGCDYRCDCNHSYCVCRGSVSKSVAEQVSYPEFMRMREERIKELRQQLSELETKDH